MKIAPRANPDPLGPPPPIGSRLYEQMFAQQETGRDTRSSEPEPEEASVDEMDKGEAGRGGQCHRMKKLGMEKTATTTGM